MIKHFYAAGFCATLILAGCATQPGASFRPNYSEDPDPIISPKLALRVGAARPSTADWVIWDSWECVVPWNGVCKGHEVIDMAAEAPGWEVCKIFYEIVSAGKGGPLFDAGTTPPYMFAGYRIAVVGSGVIYDKWGSHLLVKNLGMKMITRGATAAQREAAGCV